MSDYREIAVRANSGVSQPKVPFQILLPSPCFTPGSSSLVQTKWKFKDKQGGPGSGIFTWKEAKTKQFLKDFFFCVQYVFVFLMTGFGKSWVKSCSLLLLSFGGSSMRLASFSPSFPMGKTGSVCTFSTNYSFQSCNKGVKLSYIVGLSIHQSILPKEKLSYKYD